MAVLERFAPYNFPKHVPLAEYERVRGQITRLLAAQQGVIAVYQLGGTSAPGISDLDLLVVFERGGRSNLQPRASLDEVGRYLFTHGIFAVAAHHFALARRWMPFQGYRLLWGTELQDDRDIDFGALSESLRVQMALEYLMDNYIARIVEARYGLVDVRGMLLWGHGLRFDLQLLGVTSGSLANLVTELCEWRTRWFERPVRPSTIRSWYETMLCVLGVELDRILDEQPLTLPVASAARYSRHIHLVRSDRLRVRHSGFVPPYVYTHRRFFRMLHRFNRFEFDVPWELPQPKGDLARRLALLSALKEDRRALTPGFTPFVAGLLAKF